MTIVFITTSWFRKIYTLFESNKNIGQAIPGIIVSIGLLFIRLSGPKAEEELNEKEILERNVQLLEKFAGTTEEGLRLCNDDKSDTKEFTPEHNVQIQKDIEELQIDCIIMLANEEIIDFRRNGWSFSGYYYVIDEQLIDELESRKDVTKFDDRWYEYE